MPTIDIPGKICPHCGGTRWKTENRKKPTKANPEKRIIRYRCAEKSAEREKRWRDNNLDKIQEYWRICSREKNKERTESGYWMTPKMRERYRIKAKRDSDTLPDHFVRNIIVQVNNSTKSNIKLTSSDIPQKLIDIKRKQLLLTRQLKQLEK
jgi:rRNA maturation protein Nop10